jgi:hypothetical protein
MLHACMAGWLAGWLTGCALLINKHIPLKHIHKGEIAICSRGSSEIENTVANILVGVEARLSYCLTKERCERALYTTSDSRTKVRTKVRTKSY